MKHKDNTYPGIYLITNKTNNKRYVGQSKNITNRWFSHIDTSYRGSGLHLYLSMKRYGLSAFTFEILEIFPNEYNKKLLDEREQHYIDLYKPEYNNRNQIRKGDK